MTQINISRRSYMVAICVAIDIIVGNLWLIVKGNQTIIHPFPLLKNYGVSVEWYATYLCAPVAYVFTCFALLIMARMNQVVKIAAEVSLIYRVADLILFVLVCNVVNYIFVFFGLIISIIAVCWKEFGVKYPKPDKRHKHSAYFKFSKRIKTDPIEAGTE